MMHFGHAIVHLRVQRALNADKRATSSSDTRFEKSLR